MKRFNIAYVPKHNSKKFIELSERFHLKSHNYNLGKNSLPHITICQFIIDENEISQIWNEVCSKMGKYSITLIFSCFSNIFFDEKLFWLSIIPDLNQQLIDTFNIVSKIVKPIRNEAFDPHLTLFNYFPDNLNINFPIEENIKIEEEFELILGESDNAGQLKNIIFNFKNQYTSSCSF